ncbi:rhodanese-like domain-containing protein [Chloroflexota bacterium]
MSKKNQTRKSRRAPVRKARGPAGTPSLAIPIIVGLVVVAVIAGAILLRETQQSVGQASPGDLPGAASTARPLPTGAPPYPEVPRIALDEARVQVEEGQALLVDVRSKASFDKSHAEGAISVPEEELAAHLNELPHDKTLVLY